MKLDLISKLSVSLIKPGKVEVEDRKWVSKFAGKWKDDRSADEIVADIRKARTTNREVDL